MARGNSKQSDYKVFFVKLLSKDRDEPVFEFVQALGKDKTGEPEYYNNLEGTLVQIEPTSNEYDGKQILGFRAHFVDTVVKERYIFSASFTWLTRGIIDSLLNLDEYDDVSISVYTKTGSGDFAGKTFHNAYVRRGDEASGWKHGNDVFKPLVTELPLRKGQTRPERDYYDLDKFLQEEIEKYLADRVAEFAKINGIGKVEQPESDSIMDDTGNLTGGGIEAPPAPTATEEEDDLPF